MSKGGNQSVSQNVDPQTQAYVDQMRRAALGYAGIGGGGSGQSLAPWQQTANSRFGTQFSGQGYQPIQPQLPQGITDAQNQFNQYAQGGNLGFSALTGNAGAAQQFMNPYLSQMNPFWAQQRAGAVEGANQQATLAGAFGGDRSQIGAAAAGNFVDQNQAQAQIQAFEEAMRRAGFASQLGFGAQAQSAFLPQQYAAGQLGLLNQGLGPYGQTQTTKTSSDPFSQLLGLGLTLFGGPAGAAAGAGIGAFGGNTYPGGQTWQPPASGGGFGPATPGQVW